MWQDQRNCVIYSTKLPMFHGSMHLVLFCPTGIVYFALFSDFQIDAFVAVLKEKAQKQIVISKWPPTARINAPFNVNISNSFYRRCSNNNNHSKNNIKVIASDNGGTCDVFFDKI
jgi:hypothetical protein